MGWSEWKPLGGITGNLVYSKNNRTNILSDTFEISKSGMYLFLYSGQNNGANCTVSLNGVALTPLKTFINSDPSQLYLFNANAGDSLSYTANNSGGNSYNYVYLYN